MPRFLRRSTPIAGERALADIAAGAEGALRVDVAVRQGFAGEAINSVTLRSNELPDETATATLGTANPVLPVPINQRWLWLLAMLMGVTAMVRGRYRWGH